MAEAFGIAGSAFGTVSLGLQLFKEISQYLDDIDGRDEDLKEARNYATNVQLSLNALDIAISNAPTGDPVTKNAIDSCKASCVSAVNNLLAVVKELRGPTVTLPNSNAARAKELCAKLKYPFKKQNIEKLEETLSRTNSALQTILQVFQVNNGHATTSALKNMHQAVADLSAVLEENKTALDLTHKTSQLHHDRLGTIQQDVKELLVLTRDSEDTKLLLKTMAQQVSDLTSRTSVAASLLRNPASDPANPSIQTTSYQGGCSMTFNTFCSCKTQRVRYSQRYWGPFLLEAEVRSRDHHTPECPMSKVFASTQRTKRALSLMIPTSQRLWGCASRVSLSFTTGAGILGLSQTVTWIATVDESLCPAFRLVDTIDHYLSLPGKDMHILLGSCLRRLIWCYSNSQASVTDVNKNGETILGWALCKYFSAHKHDADNMAELFQMLSIITTPTPCRHSIIGIPLPSLVGASSWFSACKRPDQAATAILSRYREPIGRQSYDWGLSWQRDRDGVGPGYRLIQAFPQVAEDLELGLLTRAVLRQDRNGVQELLERCPTSINETNYYDQTPIHLAIETQNIAVIIVLLQYAGAEALNARDSSGRHPIDYVSKRPWKHTRETQAYCEGCKVLELLLRLDTALFPTSLCAILTTRGSRHSCKHGRKITIKGLAERRQKLKEISYRRLSPAERESLHIHQTRILDQNAARVQHQLEAQGCPVPTHLSVYEKTLYEHESIYSHISYGEVAEYARQLGFYYSDNEFAHFIRSLAFELHHTASPRYIFSSSYLCWMLDHGMSVSSRLPAGDLPSREIEVTAAHYFMVSQGLATMADQNLLLDCPLSLAAIDIVFSETLVDRCRCWCSPGGCTPLVKLLEGICGPSFFFHLLSDFELIERLPQKAERLLNSFFSLHRGIISDCQWIYAAIIRYCTFVELGLRHVCCSLVCTSSGPLPEDEMLEMEEEDSSLFGLFESLLAEFEDSRCHDISLEEFFEWMHMNWAPRMREAREELNSQRLTDEQRRDAESIGVVWEVYGPKPMEKEPELPEWREFDLWDAMDQLDEIATDPERPTKESLQTLT